MTPTERWVHKKRGGVYVVLTHDAGFQYSGAQAIEHALDGVPLTLYSSVSTGRYYVRPTSEFLDGRFEKVKS